MISSMTNSPIFKRKITQRYTRMTTLRVSELLSKDSFNIIKKIGEGAYGKVYLVEKKNTK